MKSGLGNYWMYIDKENEKFLNWFFDNHYVWHCDDLPWQYWNKENGKPRRLTNHYIRAEFMFSEFGFFNEMIKELDTSYWHNLTNEDFSFYHRQRRYIVQSHIEDDFHNPTHHSFRVEGNLSIDFKTPQQIFLEGNRKQIVTHPGNTRFQSSVFLKKNLSNALIYVNKKYYHDEMFTQKMTPVTNVKDLIQYWKPLDFQGKSVLKEDCIYTFYFQHSKADLPNGTKYHKGTDSNVLKLWNCKLKDKEDDVRARRLLHTYNYIDYSVINGRDIAKTWNEKKLRIYTNSKDNVKLYFQIQRDKLIKFAREVMEHYKERPIPKLYYFGNLNKFDFEVVYVDEKPNNISELNDNKGFAIWIDKSILYDIEREIYEFLWFTHKDVKVSETEDGKLSVVNCKTTKDKKWTINKEFYS